MAPVLKWLLITCLVALGFVVLWYLGLVQTMFETDRTHISNLVLAVFVATSLHCLVQVVQVSRELVSARRTCAVLEAENAAGFRRLDGRVSTSNGTVLDGRCADQPHRQSGRQIGTPGRRQARPDPALRGVASRLRAREKIGNFVSEALLRLALLGTTIGFILMLIPIAG
ncbi:MAG: hypothetical protein Q7T08_12635 [Devosia sp.]|nr:hypothetical protein [Devosia sp.]